jgi:hypothetical protein
MPNLLALITSSVLGVCGATPAVGPGGPSPSAPTPPRREREPRILEGTVRDAVTHRPIDRAAVDVMAPGVRGMTVQSGPDGQYRTGEIPRGDLAIRCHREGYETVDRKAEVSEGSARVDFELMPTRR